MKDEEKKKMIKKWKSLGENFGEISHPDISSPLGNSYYGTTMSLPDFNILPLAKKIAATTIGFDLVSVAPMSMPLSRSADNTKVISEVKAINRDRKIDSITEGSEYVPMKLEEHPDYKPGSGLYFIDFNYGV